MESDCSARILHFAFREIDSQIMIVLWFRGSENCHSCIFDFSASSPYLIRSRDPRESSGLINQSEMRILNSLREFSMVTHFGFQKSRQAEFSRPVIVIPRQHAPPRSRAPATRAHAHNLIQGRHMGRISHQNRTKKSCINAIRYASR